VSEHTAGKPKVNLSLEIPLLSPVTMPCDKLRSAILFLPTTLFASLPASGELTYSNHT